MPNKVRIEVEAKDSASNVFDKIRTKGQQIEKQAGTGFGLGIGAAIGIKSFNLLDTAVSKVADTVFDSIHAASDLRESMTLTEQVFGKNTDAVVEWASATDDAFSQTEALNYLSQFGNLLQGMGVGLDEATEKSETLTKIAGDLGSAFNTSSEEAALAIKSGLIGEAEPIRRFGVILSETAVKAEAMATGIHKGGGALSDTEKALARYSLILKGTQRVQGTFGKDSGSLADAQKLLETNITDLEAAIATDLIPTLATWTRTLADVAAEATEAGGAADQLGDIFGDLMNSFDPEPLYQSKTAIGDIDQAFSNLTTEVADFLTFWDGGDNWRKGREEVEAVGDTLDQVSSESAPEFVSSSREMSRAMDRYSDKADSARVSTRKMSDKVSDLVGDFKDLKSWSTKAGDALAEAAYGPEELTIAFSDTRRELKENESELERVRKRIRKLRDDGKPVPKELRDRFYDLRSEVNEGKQEVIRLGTRLRVTGGISMGGLRTEFAKLGIRLDGVTGDAQVLWSYLQKIANTDLGTAFDNSRQGIGGRAIGGPVKGGDTYLVGEKGPELFSPSMSGYIIPNNQLQGSAGAPEAMQSWGGGGSAIVVNLTVSTPLLTPGSAEALAQAIGPVLTKWQQKRGLAPAVR